MRIAMISEHASPLAALGGVDAGGQNVHVAALARHLAARGHRVEVYTRRDAPELAERVEMSPGVTVVHVPVGPARQVPKDDLLPLMDDFADWMVQDWAGRERVPQLVHAHFWMSGLAARRVGRAWGIPVALTFHALGTVKRRFQQAADTSPVERIDLERALAADVDLVIATCSDEVRELEAMGVTRDRVRVVPCGVDTTHFTPDGPREHAGRPRLLLVGRMVERKGFDTAIRALALLPGVELVIAGGPPADELAEDPEASRLARLAGELGVADRVRMVGQVAHGNLPALYRSADVVLATPWYEPFGITPLEAAASGRPVVGSAVGGLLDTVGDGETGRLVPPRDPQALGEAVRALLDDPATARRWGEAARERVCRQFGWEVVAEATESALVDVLARHGGLVGEPAGSEGAAGNGSSRWIRRHREELTQGMSGLLAQAGLVESWGARLADTLSAGGRLLAAGNGGSAAEAQHLTAEIVGRFLDERRPFSALSLCAETSSLTAILNDYGPEEVFARQVEAHGRPGDILVLLSTSGSSANVLHAAKRAREVGVEVWAMTGPVPNPLAGLADEALTIPAPSTAAVQEVHLVAVHSLCAALDAALQSRRPAPATERTSA